MSTVPGWNNRNRTFFALFIHCRSFNQHIQRAFGSYEYNSNLLSSMLPTLAPILISHTFSPLTKATNSFKNKRGSSVLTRKTCINLLSEISSSFSGKISFDRHEFHYKLQPEIYTLEWWQISHQCVDWFGTALISSANKFENSSISEDPIPQMIYDWLTWECWIFMLVNDSWSNPTRCTHY